MKCQKLSNIMVLFAFFFAQHAYADSSVWKVVKGNNQLFIGGTIHLLSPSDYPLPLEFDKAYDQSEKIVFETNIQEMRTPEFEKIMLNKVTYSDGRNLKMDLKAATYQNLERHLFYRNIPIAPLIKLKPRMVAVTLSAIEMQRLGMDAEGVDAFFRLKALNDRKRMGELETVYEQLEMLTKMDTGEQADDLIAHTLSDIQILPDIMQATTDAWRRGDNHKLTEDLLTPFMNDYPELYDEFVVKRNNAWVPKIEDMLKTKDVEFVLVGALHLVGDDGVLAQLAARGYDIQRP